MNAFYKVYVKKENGKRFVCYGVHNNWVDTERNADNLAKLYPIVKIACGYGIGDKCVTTSAFYKKDNITYDDVIDIDLCYYKTLEYPQIDIIKNTIWLRGCYHVGMSAQDMWELCRETYNSPQRPF